MVYKIICRVCGKEIKVDEAKVQVKTNVNGYVFETKNKTGKYAHASCMV